MTRMDQESRRSNRRGSKLSNNQVIAALITGLFTLAAAFVTGAYKGPGLGLGPTPRVTVTERVPVTPKHLGPTSSALQPTPVSSVSKISVLAPVNEPGFKSAWHGSVAIGAAGVRIASFGVLPGTPQDWDIAYQSGGGDAGWHTNGDNSDNGYIWYWDGTGTPNPAFCNTEHANGAGNEPSMAKLGDKYCYGDDNGLIGYLQVTSIGVNGVTAAIWLWSS